MPLDLATDAAHEAYINHTMACEACHAPTKRYCLIGIGLHDEYEANYLMSQDLHTRRTVLAKLEATDIARCESLKGKLLAIHERNKPVEP